MRHSRILVVICALMIVSSAIMAAPPTTVSYQGRLTTSAGAPVPNGSYSVRFSLWSDATLGTESWNETQMVAVIDGLFSTELGSISGGFFDISVCPPYCDVYLQIEVTIGGGVSTMSPRSHLSASPWSLVSRSLYSEDISGSARSRGIVGKKPAGGSTSMHVLFDTDSNGDGISDMATEMATDNDSASLRLNGLPPGIPVEGTLSMSASGSGARSALEGRSGSTTGTIRMAATPDSAVSVIEHDSDGDGIPESSDRRTISANDVHHNVISHSGSTTGTIRMAAMPDSLLSAMEGDADGDGNPEAALRFHEYTPTSLSTGIVRQDMVVDPDDDGTPDNSIESIVTPTKSALAIKTKGTSAQRQSIALDCESDSAGLVVESDSDGDGIADHLWRVRTLPTGSSAKLQHYGGGVLIHEASTEVSAIETRETLKSFFQTGDFPTQEQRVNASGSTFRAINTKGTGSILRSTTEATDSAMTVLESDSDGDGIAEARGIITTKPTTTNPQGRVAMSYDSDDDGTPDNTAEMIVTPTTSSMAIKTKGTGAQRQSIDLDGTADSARILCAVDLDNDGVMESSISHSSDSGGTQCKGAIRLDSTPARISTNMSIERQTKSASISEIADMDGDGLTDRSAEMVTDIDGAGITFDYQGIQARVGGRKGWDGTIKGHLRLDNGPDMNVLFESDGDGYVATRFGIGVLEPTNPLEHSSGAHLTAGGVWTNASDKKLKENFEQVDGAEILEKIEDLPISEWNYKAEGDDAKHIGPTAQDFSDAFGLGNSDKTISTIDPSGVALVAIKELTKQNKDLKKKNSELENRLDDLQKQIEKLATSMKK